MFSPLQTSPEPFELLNHNNVNPWRNLSIDWQDQVIRPLLAGETRIPNLPTQVLAKHKPLWYGDIRKIKTEHVDVLKYAKNGDIRKNEICASIIIKSVFVVLL